MDFMLALNVTIYGLGIVFLALLVLMFCIMVLGKLFEVTTGKAILTVTPTPPAQPVTEAAPTQTAESPRVAEAAPEPAGAIVGQVAAPAPSRLTPASFKLSADGKEHQVDVTPGTGDADLVVIDGRSFQVRRDSENPTKLLVDGRVHTVEVKEQVGRKATVIVDGAPFRVGLVGAEIAAAGAETVSGFEPGIFRMGIGPSLHQVEVKDVAGAHATVILDGASFKVERGETNSRVIVVNGKPFLVEVRERAGDVARVLVDGQPKEVQLLGVQATLAMPMHSAPASPAARAATETPAATAPSLVTARTAVAGERVTAPLPGKIMSVAVKPGNLVHKGDELCMIEAMKMGNSIRSQLDGTIQEVLVSPGDSVAFGNPLFVIG